MGRLPPLHRLRPILGAHHSRILVSYPRTNLLYNLCPSSSPDISSSLQSLLSRSFVNPFPFASRAFSSSSSSSPNVVLVGSDDGFNAALKKATDDKSPSIFYFTAAWCGPCRMISPIIEEMSRKFPHVTTYKFDIDQDGLSSTLRKLQIFSVPTIHFYHNGGMASEMVGADVEKLKETMEGLYKQE